MGCKSKCNGINQNFWQKRPASRFIYSSNRREKAAGIGFKPMTSGSWAVSFGIFGVQIRTDYCWFSRKLSPFLPDQTIFLWNRGRNCGRKDPFQNFKVQCCFIQVTLLLIIIYLTDLRFIYGFHHILLLILIITSDQFFLECVFNSKRKCHRSWFTLTDFIRFWTSIR